MFKTGFGFMALALTGALVTACGGDDDDDLIVVVDDRVALVDVDEDLIVTRTEWGNAFVVFDTNGDRHLVVSEFRFNAFEIADFNNDGFVTVDEWEDLLDAWDVDNDDVLEMIEFEPYL